MKDSDAIKAFNLSPRGKYIAKIQKLALKHGRCKESAFGKCFYPHCGCLYTDEGHIDPVTGEVKVVKQGKS